MTHEQSLRYLHKEYHNGLTFEEFLIEEHERNHKKAVLKSGDIGEAFGTIAELQGQIKELNKALEVLQLENDEMRKYG